VRFAFTSEDRATRYAMIVPDYHPAYGLADTTRARVLCLVKVDGLPVKEVAALNNLSPSTVYKWLLDSTLNVKAL